jgi:RNA polymerase sigma-70 factor (ECF subfamily)
MREAALPVLRGLRGLPDRAAAPACSGEARPDMVEPTAESVAWRRQRMEAFTVLDDARLLQSYRLATLILRDRDEAEDATQEAIVRAWSSWGTLRDWSRFDAWFDRILVNVCRNHMRRARTIRMVALDDTHDLQTADAHGATIARLALEPAFARLTPEQRIIVVLRFWRDLSVDDIAERLGVPAGTVKSRLHYALKALREAVESSEEAGR